MRRQHFQCISNFARLKIEFKSLVNLTVQQKAKFIRNCHFLLIKVFSKNTIIH